MDISKKTLYILLTLLLVAAAVMPGVDEWLPAQNRVTDMNIPESPSPEEGNSCLDCHENLKGRLYQPVVEWKKSVHYTVGNKCNLCHGGNPAINDAELSKSREYHFIGKPDKDVITDFCGRGGCHATALIQFKKGPHYQSVLETNQPNCTHCHGVHNIQRSSVNIITEKDCTGCHSVEYSRAIVEDIKSIETSIDSIQENINFLEKKYADVSDIQERLDRTRHIFHQLVHVFSAEEMKTNKRILELEIENLERDSLTKVAMLKRLDIFYIIMAAFGLSVIVGISFYTIYMYSKRR